jgi:hypothetical protein
VADSKLTGLTEDIFPTIDDLVYVVNDPDGTPAEKKVTVENLLSLHTPGTLVDRGDASSADFEVGGLTIDNAWHDLDLSSIVPAGAIMVRFAVLYNSGVDAARWMWFRKNGNSNELSKSGIRSETWSVQHPTIDVFCDSNRVIEYLINDSLTTLSMTVTGWITNVNQQVLGFSDKLIDRGDFSAYDFDEGDLTTDFTWYDLDLSSIVPAGTTFVYLRLYLYDDTAGAHVAFRKNGATGTHNLQILRTQVVNKDTEGYFLVPVDTNRVIEYRGADLIFTSIGIAVLGWIMDSAGHGMIDRGDPDDWDFVETDLTTDETWRDLDLSSIVPAGASFVFLGGYIVDDAVGSNLQFRKNGNSNDYHRVGSTTQVVNIGIGIDCTVPCDTNRIIEYNGSNLAFSDIKIVVKGWII